MHYLLMIFSLLMSTSMSAADTDSASSNDGKQNVSMTTRLPNQQNMLGMNVRGNKESPLTLTIVPWRSALHQVNDPELSPAWRPQLTLLQPEAYRRDINAFLKIRKTKK